MTVQEIKDLFKEYGVGMASISDLQLLLNAMGEDSTVIAVEDQLSRPMLVASFFRVVLTDLGYTPSSIIPNEVSGPLNMTDLQLSLVKLGTDYVA